MGLTLFGIRTYSYIRAEYYNWCLILDEARMRYTCGRRARFMQNYEFCGGERLWFGMAGGWDEGRESVVGFGGVLKALRAVYGVHSQCSIAYMVWWVTLCVHLSMHFFWGCNDLFNYLFSALSMQIWLQHFVLRSQSFFLLLSWEVLGYKRAYIFSHMRIT